MEFQELIRSRYSVRKFKPTPVEQEKLAQVLSAVSLAPTACNYQPQKIYVLQSEEARAKLKAICPCTFDAPVLFVIAYDESRSAHGLITPDFDFGVVDASIVCTHLMLAAQDLGLGTCWVGYLKRDEVSAALGLPENEKVIGLLPMGYPADDAAPAPLHTKTRPAEDMITCL